MIETCLEGGPLTREEISQALAGKAAHPELKAVISWLEYRIGELREQSEAAGTEARARDELCGAARELKLVRRELLEFVATPKA